MASESGGGGVSGIAWTNFSSSIVAVAAAPVQPNFAGTVIVDQASYAFDAGTSTLFIQIEYATSSAGSAGTGVYTWSLPSGYNVDTTRCNLAVVLPQNQEPNGSMFGPAEAFFDLAINQHGSVQAYSPTQLVISAHDGSIAYVGSTHFPLTGTNGGRFMFSGTIPVVEV
jgi:hypothetical protein